MADFGVFFLRVLTAEADYVASAELDPTNEALQNDLLQVQSEKAKRDLSSSSSVAHPSKSSSDYQMHHSSTDASQVASAC